MVSQWVRGWVEFIEGVNKARFTYRPRGLLDKARQKKTNN